MANNVTINVRAKDAASSEIERIKGRLQSLSTSKGFKDVMSGAAMGAGIAAFNMVKGAAFSALEGVGTFVAGSVEAASDTAEAVSKVGVVFGDSAGKVRDFAETAATSMGASRLEALNAAGTFGNLFTTMGLAQTAAADMSVEVVKLAGDLASFNNIDTADALEKLRAGLVGEAEPLRALGVNLNAAAVEAKAMEMGLARTRAELTDSAKVQARYALILEQTTTAQGDFERTSDGLANTQRTLNAQLADLQAEIGEELLPVAVELAQVFRDDIMPALREATGAIGPAAEAFGFVADSVRLTLDPMGAFRDRMDELNARVLDETTAKLAEGAREWDTFAEGSAAARDAALKVAAGVKPLPSQLEDTADAARDAARGFLAAKDAWQRLNDAIDEQNEFANLPDKITVAADEVKNAQRELNGAIEEGNKVAIAAARIRLRDAQAELNELRRRWAQLRVEMSKPVTVGGIGPGQNSAPPRPQAGGFVGTVSGATTMLVGEAGSETVAILRNPEEVAIGGAAAGPVVQNVIRLELDGRVLAEVVDRELYQRLATASTSRRVS